MNPSNIDVLVCEVGMRDGLQSVSRTMATADKKKWIDALYAAGVRELTVHCSASAAHSLANVRKTREQMVDEVRSIVALKNDVAPHVQIEAGISVAFGCTLQGVVPDDDVIWLLEQVVAAGADESGLADTTGMANPAQVRRLFKRAIATVGLQHVGAAHMHNTRGLGGCPHAPGASGNVVTEDVVMMFEAMGLRTGIDLEKLIAAREPLKLGLPGEPLYGMTAVAGLPMGFVYADGRRLKTVAPSAFKN